VCTESTSKGEATHTEHGGRRKRGFLKQTARKPSEYKGKTDKRNSQWVDGRENHRKGNDRISDQKARHSCDTVEKREIYASGRNKPVTVLRRLKEGKI